jgi:hypothetical protein
MRAGADALPLEIMAAATVSAVAAAAIASSFKLPSAERNALSSPVRSCACKLTEAIDAASAKQIKLFFINSP